MTGVSSSAAVATLTVPASVLENDLLLHLVSRLASPNQLKVSVVKKGGNNATLETSSGESLTERNAILRALAGPVLHYALDGRDLYLLGGAASLHGSSVVPSVVHWMTMGSSSAHPLELEQLEAHLEDKAFLVPSSCATLADYHVLLELLTTKQQQQDTYQKNVLRWMFVVHAQLVALTERAHETTKIPLHVPPLPVEEPPIPIPVFYYGNADEQAIAAPTTTITTTVPTTIKEAPNKKPELSEEEKKAAAEKRAKKNAQKAAKKKAAPPPAQTTDFDIMALDIRVGHIVKVWNHPDADKLYCEEIDLNEGTPRKIASGLRPFYASADDLLNKRVLVLCNLKTRNLVGYPSHGMVLCATSNDNGTELVSPPEGAAIGERVLFGDKVTEPESESRVAKKKLLEKLLPPLRTNAEGVVTWNDLVGMTTAGPCLSLPNGQVS